MLLKHGDVRMVDKLYLAMPKGARHAAMAQFILKHFAVTPNTDTATKKQRPFLNDPSKHNDIDGAAKDKWFKCKPSPSPDKVFDLQAAVKSLLKRAGDSACMIGSIDMLKALAETAGLPESDVPTNVKAAATVQQARELIAESKSV